MNKANAYIKTMENLFQDATKNRTNKEPNTHKQTTRRLEKWGGAGEKGANILRPALRILSLTHHEATSPAEKGGSPCSQNKEATVKAALQRSFFRNTTGENQETGRARSRTDDNKQDAEKREKGKKMVSEKVSQEWCYNWGKNMQGAQKCWRAGRRETS